MNFFINLIQLIKNNKMEAFMLPPTPPPSRSNPKMYSRSNSHEIKLPPIPPSSNNNSSSKTKYMITKKIKTLEERIQTLPDELMRYIFDYVKIFIWHQEFTTDLKSDTSQRLDIYRIRPWIPRILSNKNFTHYCIQKDQYFKKVWEIERKKNQKQFRLMKKGNSFAQSLLMYHYH
jgi:hypothetical protein